MQFSDMCFLIHFSKTCCASARMTGANDYIILYYIILYYIILYYIILYYITLYYVMLCYVMLCYVMLCYVILYYIIFHYITLYLLYLTNKEAPTVLCSVVKHAESG